MKRPVAFALAISDSRVPAGCSAWLTPVAWCLLIGAVVLWVGLMIWLGPIRHGWFG